MAEAPLDRDVCYRALRTRDPRFDGRFYTAVVSTGIYCRPICPARTPKIESCLFLPSAGAAHQMGFRPCLRCRPEVAPGLAGATGTASTVSRALGLIAEGGFDEGGADELASRLGIGARHLRRLFDRHVGAAPVAVAQAHRILFAKKLLGETSLSMTEIAEASGFGSVRRFNAVFVDTYGRAPSELRRSKRGGVAVGPAVVLKLPFREPYDWEAIAQFLAARSIPGVEAVTDGCYRRTFELGGVAGVLEVSRARDASHLLATIHASDVKALGPVVARLRRLFDLDADIGAVDAHLGRDRALARGVRKRPGIRVPGAWDAFELAVRAVLGQQVSVRAATTFAGRLVAAHGRALPSVAGRDGAAELMLFPTAATLAEADLTGIGLTRTRAATLNALSAACAARPKLLEPGRTLEQTVEELCAVPGIGPWTAQYIAMRALRETDAFPASDLGLLRAMATSAGRPTPSALAERAEAWRPWRAYAALRLWTCGAPPSGG